MCKDTKEDKISAENIPPQDSKLFAPTGTFDDIIRSIAETWLVLKYALPLLLIYFWPRATPQLLLTCFLSSQIRLFAEQGFGHRYFAHKSFECVWWLKQLCAILIISVEPPILLYWMYVHNHHHRECETEEDRHSPLQTSFWNVQLGPFGLKIQDLLEEDVRVKGRYRHRTCYGTDFSWLSLDSFAIIFFGEIAFWIILGPLLGYGRFELLFWACSLPRLFTCAMIRLTNSAGHMFGTKPYPMIESLKECNATNCWWGAIINGGECWHNNHHAYALSGRHGFLWWEIDTTYYTLYALALLGLVWDIRVVSKDIVEYPRFSGKPAPKASYDVIFKRSKGV
jgi:stearoyl-CoA desaturase (delta-9 desaturase)